MTELESTSGRAMPCPPPAAPLPVPERSRLDVAMSRYAEGDDTAFTELFAGLSPRLHAFLRRLGCSTDLAEDLTQETLLKMHQARGTFAREKSVIPWAYAIARNCYLSYARSPKARLAKRSVDDEAVQRIEGREGTAEETSIARQTAAVVQRALAGMTEVRREAFILLRYEGLSVAAAAQVVGITETALKVRAFHAYETIRTALRELEADSIQGGSC